MGGIMKQKIGLLFILIITLGIFSLSLQDAPTSTELSQGIADKLMTTPIANHVPSGYTMNNFIRDLAHMGEFFFLSFCTMLILCLVGCPLSRCVNLTLLYVVFVSFTDELIQYFFSPGRAFEWIDLAKDWTGMFLAMLTFALLYNLYVYIYSRFFSPNRISN